MRMDLERLDMRMDPDRRSVGGELSIVLLERRRSDRSWAFVFWVSG